MTNKKEVAQAIIDAFDCEYYQKARTRQDALANVLREVVNQLKYIGITEKNILEIVDELENL